MNLRDHGWFGYAPDDGVTKFVIVYTSRTGSNFLSSTLDSHPQILCHHELFNAGGIHGSLGCEQQGIDLELGTVEDRDRNPWRFLNTVFQRTLGHSTVGFKLAAHENKPVLVSVLLNRRIRKIVLRRDNLLDTFVSNLIAEHTGQWIQKTHAAAAAGGRPKVHVEPAAFRRYVRKMTFLYGGVRRMLAMTGQIWVDFEYNEIRDEGRMRELLAFLGVEATTDLTSSTRRQNPSPQRDKIRNYDELAAELAGSSHARFLTA